MNTWQNKRYQKLPHTSSHFPVGREFVQIFQAGEAGIRSKEIGLDSSSSFRALPSQLHPIKQLT